MKTKSIMQNHIVRIALGTAAILLIPLVMTIHDGAVEGEGWNWTLGDFIVMGTLIFGAGLTYELISRRVSKKIYKVVTFLAVAFLLFLIWIELAVGGVSQLVHFLLSS